MYVSRANMLNANLIVLICQYNFDVRYGSYSVCNHSVQHHCANTGLYMYLCVYAYIRGQLTTRVEVHRLTAMNDVARKRKWNKK
jgi:hypothetical protein